MINFLDVAEYTNICTKEEIMPIFSLAKLVIRIIQIAVPFALVIWGSLDWFKALIAGDEKEMKMKRKPFISRVVAAIVILVLPWIVDLIAGQIAGPDRSGKFWACYTEAKPGINFDAWHETDIDE